MTTTATDLETRPLTPEARRFQTVFTTPTLFRAMLLAKLPLFMLTGAKVEHLDLERCRVELPFGWINRNPFGSMYFASIMMSAEATTGGLVLLHRENRAREYSAIVSNISGDFERAAYSKMTFECDRGHEVDRYFERADRTGERESHVFTVEGRTEEDGVVARVEVTWSLRAK
ncbi:MAG: DUF4442 domain-containing protein [Persicimonas sp.]